MKHLLLLFLVGILISCRKDKVEVTPLDDRLDSALVAASGGNDRYFYLLPESDDLLSIPQDPNNPLTYEKVALGKLLYHETGLAINSKTSEGMGTYSCASCHNAQAGFQAGLNQGIGDGGIGFGIAGEGRTINPIYSTDSIDVQPIRSPSALNVAYQEVMLWNGQFGATGMNEGTSANWTVGTPKEVNNLGYEGIETQAIAGLTVHRMRVDISTILNGDYKEMFDYAFPDIFPAGRYTKVTAGLAIAAYERTLLANQAPFQRWIKGDHDAMTDDEKEGALIFFGKGGCYKCHNGPALNSMNFYALGMNDLESTGAYGPEPDDATRKGRGGFTGNSEDDYKFKVPQLYSLKRSKFYGHGASFTDLLQVILYKNAAVKENSLVPDAQLADEFVPLNLTADEIYHLYMFLSEALDDPDLMRYVPSYVPSGNCFPNNDTFSKYDLGCD